MTRFLLFLVVLVLEITTAATAQVAAPAITQVVGHCVRPGDMLTLHGRGLGGMGDQRPALRHDRKTVLLDVLNRGDSKLTVRLPKDAALEDGKRYPLVLLDGDKKHKYTETGLSVELCAAHAGPAKPAIFLKANEILVLVETRGKATLLETLKSAKHDVVRQRDLRSLGFFLAVLRVEEKDMDDVISALRKKLPGAQIDANQTYHPAGTPRLYAPEKISWPKPGAKCLGKTGGIPIGIIDGGVEKDDAAFSGSFITAKNFLDEGVTDRYHGTAVASALAGKTGMLADAKLFAAVVLKENDKKLSTATSESIARALDWLLRNDVRLINVSLAAQRQDKVLDILFKKTIKAGAIVFAAAGNAGPGASPAYPAAIDGVIAVTATDAADRIYANANQGDYIDFAAPGVDVWLVDPEQGGVYKSGTSYAAPYALAVAALVLGRNREVPRDLVVKTMLQNAKDLGRRGHDTVFGHGLVQADCR